MSNERKFLLESVQERLESLSEIPPELTFAIAERIEEALSSSSRAPLQNLAEQLGLLFNKIMRKAPREAMEAARGSAPVDSVQAAAYLLGQISFAQLVTAQAAERRVDDEFFVVMRDHRYEKYVKALFHQDSTGVELAKATGETEETASRKLKRLRELGISDFRREGTKLLNFLTPSARVVVAEAEEPIQPRQSQETVDYMLEDVEPHMKSTRSLARPQLQAA